MGALAGAILQSPYRGTVKRTCIDTSYVTLRTISPHVTEEDDS